MLHAIETYCKASDLSSMCLESSAIQGDKYNSGTLSRKNAAWLSALLIVLFDHLIF
jgi:hypothetical protein